MDRFPQCWNITASNLFGRLPVKKEPTLTDYINILWDRRRLILVCTAVAAVVALVLSFILPKTYEAEVTFKLDLSESKPLFYSPIFTQKQIDPVESQLEIIQSRTLAQAVVKKLGLNFIVKDAYRPYFDSVFVADACMPGKYYLRFNDGGFSLSDTRGDTIGTGTLNNLYDSSILRFYLTEKPADNIRLTIIALNKRAEILQEQVSVDQIKNSQLVRLKARSRNPRVSAAIANTLAAEYINYSLRTVREVARGSKEFIESQIQVFGDELGHAEEDLRQYKERTGIFLLNASAHEVITSLAQFETERERAIVALHESESAIENLEAELSRDAASYGAYKQMASFPTLSSSPIIVSLKDKLQTLELRKQELAQTEAGSGDISRIEAQILNTEQDLQKATKQIVLAGPSIEDPIFRSIITQIIDQETRAISLQSRIAALNQIIRGQNNRLKQLPEAEVELAQLERQKMANEEIYTMLLGKLEESKIAEAMQISEARIIDAATVPEKPTHPRPVVNTVLGVLLGMMIGIGGVILKERLDTSVKTARDIEELTDSSVLASIPLMKGKERALIATVEEPHSETAEAYRILRTNIAFATAARQIQTLLVTSTMPQEGKTTTCINLGITLAQQGHKVIVVDCDFRRPMLHNYFAQYVKDNRHGLSDVLIGRLKLESAIVNNTVHNLSFITSGTIPSNPAELLGSEKMVLTIEKLKAAFEYVIIDAPPTLGVADARVLGRICDGVLVVVMAQKTHREAVVDVKSELERSGEKVVGFVLNGIDITSNYYRRRSHYYHYQSK
jgi:tyrosine-protein kinase Etk/Wzc